MATATWLGAGKPVRTRVEVLDILHNKCFKCDYLLDKDTPSQRCGLCGCPVNDNMQVASMLKAQLPKNKLLLATESCPDDPPQWVAKV